MVIGKAIGLGLQQNFPATYYRFHNFSIDRKSILIFLPAYADNNGL
jgi:uncharacterized secreted protein with C-terminal beta-propeller domain